MTLHPIAWLPLVALVCLAGCANDPHAADRARQEQSAVRAQALAETGYQPAESNTLTLALQEWAVAGVTMPVSLAFPGRGSQLPLVVYLPGLGESAQAGSLWREAWARAGYAVLSAQPLEFDASAWRSDLARNADFMALSRAHQTPELMPERIRHLHALLDEARRRARTGDSLWSRVDFSNIAFAGYDLGSLLAAAVPGARATLLISPLPLDAATAAGIARPLLMIDSERDQDLTGLIASPQQRVQSFASLPIGDKTLLMLDGASHGLLSGDVGQDDAEQAGEPASASPAHSSDRQGGRQGGRHGDRQGGAHARGGERSAHRPRPAEGGPEQAQAIKTVSIAFLDAQLRGREQARQWLAHKAGPWLSRLGTWQTR